MGWCTLSLLVFSLDGTMINLMYLTRCFATYHEDTTCFRFTICLTRIESAVIWLFVQISYKNQSTSKIYKNSAVAMQNRNKKNHLKTAKLSSEAFLFCLPLIAFCGLTKTVKLFFNVDLCSIIATKRGELNRLPLILDRCFLFWILLGYI